MNKYAFGVDIGGTTIKIGLFETTGKLLEKWEIITRKENKGGYILADIASALENKRKERNISKSECEGIGLGVPGPVSEDGTVLKCVNLGWEVFNIEEALSMLTGLPVKAGNDANVAALGETWQGGAKGYNNVVMVTLGTGVGGGIIIGGKVVTGTNGAGGEIGHFKISANETEACGCGKKGCLEQYASATGIVKEANKLLASTETPSRLRDIERLTAKDIFNEAKAGDTLSVQLVDVLGEKLGTAFSYISCVCDPQVFVIGGGVSNAGTFLLDTVQAHYKAAAFHSSRNAEFKLAELGNDAGIYGGVNLIL